MREKVSIRAAARRLAELLTEPVQVVERETKAGADALLVSGTRKFLVEIKLRGDLASVSGGIDRLVRLAPSVKGAIPLLVVPFMGPVARARCHEIGISWLDLSGNADVVGPGLRLLVEGKRNQFIKPGRPSSAFAPKSARVVRALLLAGEPLRQREISERTKLDEGYVSRIVSRLEKAGLLSRTEKGAITIPDLRLVLEAWREAYDFERHEVTRWTVAARSGEELQFRARQAFVDLGISYAATGLGAAWLYTKMVAFRLVTLFVVKLPAPGQLEDELGARAAGDEANLWIVRPNDDHVLLGRDAIDGIQCAAPFQVWLDLKGHPERSREASDALAAHVFRGRP